MTKDGNFDLVLIGPDGRAEERDQPLVNGQIPDELTEIVKEGPFSLKARYVRTQHTVRGRARFDWSESVRVDTDRIYRLASVDGLGVDIPND